MAQQEAILQAVGFATQCLLQGRSWEESIGEALARLGEAAGVACACVWQNYRDEQNRLGFRMLHGWQAPGSSYPPSGLTQGIYQDVGLARWEQLFAAGQPIYAQGRELPASEQEALHLKDSCSVAALPILVGDEWWGVLSFNECRAEREWLPQQRKALRAAADALGTAIHHQRTEAALRASEERYRRLVEHSPYAIGLEIDGKVAFLNQAGASILGAASPAEIVGCTVLDLVEPAHRSITAGNMRRIHEGLILPPVELALVRVDGSLVDVELAAMPVMFQGQLSVQVMFQDITIRKRAMQALQESEELYRTLVETSPDSITVTDLQGHFVIMNRQGARRYGAASPEEFVAKGLTTFDLIVPEDRARAAENMRRAFEAGAVFDKEYMVLRQDGSRYPATISASLLTDAQGNPKGFVGVTRDITERKRAEEALRASEEAYRGLFSNIGDAFILLDQGLRVADFHDTPQGVFGLAREQVVGKTLAEAFAGLYLPDEELTPILEEVLHLGKPRSYLGARYDRPGSAPGGGGYLDLVAYGVSMGGQRHVALLCRDVSDLRRMELELRRAQHMEALGRWASGVAHDFGAILAVIQAECDLLATRLPPEHVAVNELQGINRAIEHGKMLRQDLLAFSRGVPTQIELLHLHILLRRAERMLRSLLGEQVRLILDLADGPILFWGDAGQFDRILLNLASNARDAMPEGGTLTIQTRRVTFSPEEARFYHLSPGPYALMAVCDTGVGMSEAMQQRVFEPLFTTKKGEKAGLGLAVVYGIMQQHHGFVRVESRLGHGSTFFIYFPALESEMLEDEE